MIVTRFAPSPTGPLHLGHAYAALYARERGERFLLRMEDIDVTRSRPEFETAICEDLAWLGVAWDGPVLPAGTPRRARCTGVKCRLIVICSPPISEVAMEGSPATWG